MSFLNFEISKEKQVLNQLGLHLLVCVFVLQPLVFAEGGRAPLTAQGFVSCQPHDAVKIHRLWVAGGSCTQPRQSFVPEKAGIICYIR